MDDHIPHWHIIGFTLMTIAATTTTWLLLLLIGAWTLLILALLAGTAWTYLWLDRRWTKPHLRHRDHRTIQATVAFTTKTLLVGVFFISAPALASLWTGGHGL